MTANPAADGLRFPFLSKDPRSEREQKRRALFWKRIGWASLIALALHLIFFFGVFPYLDFHSGERPPTEVVQISQEDLARMKQQILQNKTLPPLHKSELREEFKTKEKPKNAQFMGAFNQTVPEETVAGAQRDAPREGGGAKKNLQKAQPVKLSDLGLGSSLPKPRVQISESRQGPPGPSVPLGRENSKMKKGVNNLFNAVENEYYGFFSRFEDPIVRNWFFLLRTYEGRIRGEMAQRKIGEGAQLPVTVEFTIDRAGTFQRIHVIQSSGIPTLDWATLEAVKKLQSLPNPPEGVFEGGQYFTYRLNFSVLITAAPMVSSSPDMSWY